MAKIDIVIPVYNQADKILDCLKSLKAQTFQDFDVIIVNDGSTDNVEQIVDAWLRSDTLQEKNPLYELSTKTRFITQDHGGAPKARNAGAQLSKNEYVLFCDADVILNPAFLKTSFNELEKKSEFAYCYSSFRYGWKKFKLFPFDPDRLRQIPYIHTTSLMRRKDFPGFDEKLKKFQDWDIWLTMLESGKKGIWIPKILFRVQAGGTMSHWMPKFFVMHFKNHPRVKAYDNAMAIIREKHHLHSLKPHP